MLPLNPFEIILAVIGCVAVLATLWWLAGRVLSNTQAVHDVFTLVSTGAVILGLFASVTIWIFPLQFQPVALVAVCAVVGSAFAELKDTWKSDSQQFSIPRVLFRTAQWATLAVAGYIVVQVLAMGNMD